MFRIQKTWILNPNSAPSLIKTIKDFEMRLSFTYRGKVTDIRFSPILMSV